MSRPDTARRVRFDRNGLSGAFGDLGTDFPLVLGMVLAAGLDVTSVLVMFGLMQILTGLAYGWRRTRRSSPVWSCLGRTSPLAQWPE